VSVKVAIITRDYPPKIGGISTHTSALARSLAELGVQVEVLAGYSDLGTLVIPFRYDLGKYDLVHVQSSPYGAFVSKHPLVVTVHSPVKAERRYYNRSLRAKSYPAILFEKLTLRRADSIVVVSETTRNDLIERYGIRPERISVIPNGVEFERFSAVARDKGGIGPLRVAIVSRLEPRKNIAEAFEGLARLPRGGHTLEVIGDGSERAKLEELARELGLEVRFSGAVSEEGLPSAYGRADVLLTASRSEGFGLTLLEASAAGCAIVASDIAAHRELVSDGRNGLLFSGSDDLAKKLLILCNNRELVSLIGENAREAAKKFSWKDVASAFVRLYELCLDAGMVQYRMDDLQSRP